LPRKCHLRLFVRNKLKCLHTNRWKSSIHHSRSKLIIPARYSPERKGVLRNVCHRIFSTWSFPLLQIAKWQYSISCPEKQFRARWDLYNESRARYWKHWMNFLGPFLRTALNLRSVGSVGLLPVISGAEVAINQASLLYWYCVQEVFAAEPWMRLFLTLHTKLSVQNSMTWTWMIRKDSRRYPIFSGWEAHSIIVAAILFCLFRWGLNLREPSGMRCFGDPNDPAAANWQKRIITTAMNWPLVPISCTICAR
jgi:hypothetical protein